MLEPLNRKKMNRTIKILGMAFFAMIVAGKSYGDVADFSYSTACDGSAVIFTSTSTVSGGTIVSYQWDFNSDGIFTDASGAVVSHLFPSSGYFSAGLRIISSLNVTTTIYKTITVNPLAVADFIASDACLGNYNSFTDASTLTTGSIVKYKWDLNNDGIYEDSSAALLSKKFSAPGSYFVGHQVITDSGCVSVISKSVKVNQLPVVDFTFDKTCLNDTTEFVISSSVAGGSIVKYYWNFDGDGMYENSGITTSNKTSFIAAGNYQVQVKTESEKGCMKDTSKLVVIAPRPVLIFSYSNQCEDQAVQFDNTFSQASSFKWDFGDGSTSTLRSPQHIYRDPGTFSVSLTGSSAFGCTENYSKPITIHPTPLAAFSSHDVCIGGLTEFMDKTDANGAPIKYYYWDFGDQHGEIIQHPVHTYESPGLYKTTLIVSNIFNCTDTFDMHVNVWSLPKVVITASGPVEFCRNDSVVLSVNTSGNTILWSSGENKASITAKNGGKYRAVLFDDHGCINWDSIMVVVNELPVIIVSPEDTTISLGKTVELHASGASTYVWTPVDYLDNSFIANPVSLPLKTTVYTVLGEDMNGCKNTQSMKLNVDRDYLLDMTNLLTPNGDGANEVWDIGASFYTDNEVVIYNRWGAEIFRQKAYHDDWNGTFEGKEVPEGAYYYIIKFDGSDKVYSGSVTVLR